MDNAISGTLFAPGNKNYRFVFQTAYLDIYRGAILFNSGRIVNSPYYSWGFIGQY